MNSYSLSQIKKKIYNSTTAAVPSPAYHLMQYDRQLKQARNEPVESTPFVGSSNNLGCLDTSAYNFNSEPLSSEDIFAYRRSRSEHLLIRMLHAFTKHEFNHSFVRLSKGTFLLQKYEASEPVDFPSPTTFSNAIDLFVQDDAIAPIDTFTFNDLFNDMMTQTTSAAAKAQQEAAAAIAAAEAAKNAFKPFTYTLGIRFTNPFNHMNDLLVRGNIPLWCQTLFITECMRILPIQQGATIKGLLPFGKDIEFHFTRLPLLNTNDTTVVDPYPELLVMFERFAMELTDPQTMLEIPQANQPEWREKLNTILNGVLYCDIPDETAALITTLADAWAKAQGISIS